jgi:hypothetical protein
MFEICLFLGLTVVVIFSVLIIYWLSNSCGFPKIKYRDFRKYYKLNPERWYCGLHTVRYEMSDGSGELFNFGLIGFYRYKLWQHKIDLAEKRKECAESMQRFLDDVNKTEAEND